MSYVEHCEASVGDELSPLPRLSGVLFVVPWEQIFGYSSTRPHIAKTHRKTGKKKDSVDKRDMTQLAVPRPKRGALLGPKA